MAKPSITKRQVKGAALTYAELDTNFQNLADATVNITAGTGGTTVSTDLNGNVTLVAGSNITLSGNNSTKQITIASTATSANSFSTINANGDNVIAGSSADTLTLVPGAGVGINADIPNKTIYIGMVGPSGTVTYANSCSWTSSPNYLGVDNMRIGVNASGQVYIRVDPTISPGVSYYAIITYMIKNTTPSGGTWQTLDNTGINLLDIAGNSVGYFGFIDIFFTGNPDRVYRIFAARSPSNVCHYYVTKFR